MPLIPSKSKKAFSKNVETEMEHGKPQNQALAVAYAVKKKAKRKKMASGGSVESGSSTMNYAEGGRVNESARSERRPMPQELDKDRQQVSQNSSQKSPSRGDSMLQDDISFQAKKGMKTSRIKHPRMVASDILQARLRDEEDDLQSSASPGPYDAQPPKHDDEEGAQRQGPQVPDMQDEHSTKRKPYAKGGQVEQSDYAARPNKYEDDLQDLDPSQDEAAQMARSHNEEGPDRQGPDIHDHEEAHYMDSDQYEDSEQYDREMELNPAHDKHSADDSHKQPEEEAEEMHHASIAAAIMAKDRRMKQDSDSDIDREMLLAEGGEVRSRPDRDDIHSHESIYSDDSDQADLSRNADEDANEEDQLSFNALRKENYSESEGLRQLDQPEDSNLHGDEEESDSENVHDRSVADKIRLQMKRRSPISR